MYVAMVVATVLVVGGGCREPDEIRQYTVKKPPAPPATHRMLSAVVPDDGLREKTPVDEKRGTGTQAWFFKIVGPVEQVDDVADAFDQFVATIRVDGEGLPKWTLPDGWTEDSTAGAPEFGREATIRIGQGSSQLELAVSKLPMPKERRESWLLGNINRWRGQLQLPPIARSELEEFTDEIKAGDETAIKVDFRGAYSGPPMAGMFGGKNPHGQRNSASTEASSRKAAKSDASSAASAPRAMPFEADVPSVWKPGRMNEFRVAAYYVGGGDGGAPAEMTVTPLGPAAGDLKANVDRWRGEIKLPSTTSGELEELTKTIEIDGQKADYVHLIGPENASPREATLGVILRRPDRVWFFKLRGPVDVVEREKQRFEEYVKSVKFK
jgi:hypothetical protein